MVVAVVLVDVAQVQRRRSTWLTNPGVAGRHLWQAAAQLGHLGIAEGARLAPAKVEVALQVLQAPAEQADDQHVVHGHGAEGFQHQEVLRVEALADQQQLAEGDHRDQRGQLDDGHVLVGQGRQGDAKGLRHDDQALRAETADAQRASGLALPFGYRKQTAAVDFRHVRRLGQYQGEQTGVERVGQYLAAGRHQLRQVVDEDQQHQQRHAAKEPYVDRGWCAEPATGGLLGTGQTEAQHQAEQPGQAAEFHHRPARGPEGRHGKQGEEIAPFERHMGHL